MVQAFLKLSNKVFDLQRYSNNDNPAHDFKHCIDPHIHIPWQFYYIPFLSCFSLNNNLLLREWKEIKCNKIIIKS